MSLPSPRNLDNNVRTRIIAVARTIVFAVSTEKEDLHPAIHFDEANYLGAPGTALNTLLKTIMHDQPKTQLLIRLLLMLRKIFNAATYRNTSRTIVKGYETERK